MFTLKCFCSKEAILCNQEVACFVISLAVVPEGRDGTVWTDFELLRKLASGTPPRIQSTGGKVAWFLLMTLDLGAKRW